jgi:hypothetical protein
MGSMVRLQSSTPPRPTDGSQLLTETAVLERWPQLTARELRRARKANPPRIAFYDFPLRQGGPCYTAAQVWEYLDRTYLKTAPSPHISASDANSLTASLSLSEPSAITPELEEQAVEAIIRNIRLRRLRSPRIRELAQAIAEQLAREEHRDARGQGSDPPETTSRLAGQDRAESPQAHQVRERQWAGRAR